MIAALEGRQATQEARCGGQAEAMLESQSCVLHGSGSHWKVFRRGVTGSHLNLEMIPLAAALRMEDKRGSWKIARRLLQGPGLGQGGWGR